MRVTLKEIAEKAGVSINTVSLALRDMHGVKPETRERIVRIADDMGYDNQRSKPQKPQNISLISRSETLSDMYFYMNFHQRIMQKAHEYNYSMISYSSHNCNLPQKDLDQLFKLNSIGGILLLGDVEEEIVEKVLKTNIPMVSIGDKHYDLPVSSVIEDNLEGSFLAVRHFLKQGYDEIGFIGSPDHSIAFMERYLGYLGAMHELKLDLNSEQMILDIDFESIDYKFQFLAEKLKKMPNIPKAFLCANDNVAMVAAKAFYSLGLRVPEDISLIGFDNSESGKMAIPSITSVDVHCELQADTAIKMLTDFMSTEKSTYERIVIPVELVLGDSVGKIE